MRWRGNGLLVPNRIINSFRLWSRMLILCGWPLMRLRFGILWTGHLYHRNPHMHRHSRVLETSPHCKHFRFEKCCVLQRLHLFACVWRLHVGQQIRSITFCVSSSGCTFNTFCTPGWSRLSFAKCVWNPSNTAALRSIAHCFLSSCAISSILLILLCFGSFGSPPCLSLHLSSGVLCECSCASPWFACVPTCLLPQAASPPLP